MPNIPARELQKLDRGDKLIKVLALAQILYLIVQLIARKVRNLPSTQLEVAALAFSASSILTYLLYWGRPQGVESVKVLKAKKTPRLRNLDEFVRASPTYFWTRGRSVGRLDDELDLVPLPNDGSNVVMDLGYFADALKNVVGDDQEFIPLAFGAVFGGTLFGGLHCLAWSFHFPTSGEQLAWRICSIITTCLPVLSLFPLGLWLSLNRTFEEKMGSPALRFAVATTCMLVLVTYILARLFLLIEIFRSLFFLPPEAFIETWSGNFPHFG